jgi:TPP-dependent pyruvate/acetoin dehydrogenase alpha subunit
MENPFDPGQSSLESLSFDRFREEVFSDYRWVALSREVSLLGRREVLTGKAKFGIFGDGKEVAQVAMAKFFQPGDFRSGYYRDQTFMFASGLATVEQFFAQLYADPDINHDPFSAGRQMNAHFSSRFVNDQGEFLDLVNRKNVSADIAPTAGQMTRGLGLAFASRAFRKVKELKEFDRLSNHGNEVCFCTIGDASTSEGHFWETVNAAGVLQVPLAIFIWDDGYGISVPKKYQTTKSSISDVLSGFQKEDGTNGLAIYKVKGWDYAGMCETFEEGIRVARETHTPVLFHVEEITQPQGHSTSGSHERYKTPERLEWESQWDGQQKMREWIIANALAEESELEAIETEVKETVKKARLKAWEDYINPIKKLVEKTTDLLNDLASKHQKGEEINAIIKELTSIREPLRRDVLRSLSVAIELAGNSEAAFWVKDLYKDLKEEGAAMYNSTLYN